MDWASSSHDIIAVLVHIRVATDVASTIPLEVALLFVPLAIIVLFTVIFVIKIRAVVVLAADEVRHGGSGAIGLDPRRTLQRAGARQDQHRHQSNLHGDLNFYVVKKGAGDETTEDRGDRLRAFELPTAVDGHQEYEMEYLVLPRVDLPVLSPPIGQVLISRVGRVTSFLNSRECEYSKKVPRWILFLKNAHKAIP